ncbi:MAG: hypothetical protein ACYSWS_08905 [Planctomycetota bacterium]|jgi:hypothetical protein
MDDTAKASLYNNLIRGFVFILVIGLQDYAYSSSDGVERYTQQCKTFLNRNSGKFKDKSFEKLLGYIGNATICKKEKIYKKLTEDEKYSLKEINLNIDQIKKILPKEKLERINESITAIMPIIENELWEDLTKEELRKLDIVLRRIWNSMRSALEQNDIDKAVSYFHHDTRDMYWKNFVELKPENRKKISNDLAKISMKKIEMNEATYEVTSGLKKGEAVSFLVTFIKDLDGKWAIKSF